MLLKILLNQYRTEPLKNIINLSFSKGIFPDKLKVAKVIPVFTADEPDLFTSCRPVSLLPNFSKFFEKVVHSGLVEFANSHDIFYQLQFGILKNHSTTLSLIYLVKKTAMSIDQNEITAGVFPDLSKAFDTLDHQILFHKLEHYGVCGLALQWIKSQFLESLHSNIDKNSVNKRMEFPRRLLRYLGNQNMKQ